MKVDYKKTSIAAREFISKFWFDNNVPSKAVTQILGWIKNDRLTNEGKKQYKTILLNKIIYKKDENPNPNTAHL